VFGANGAKLAPERQARIEAGLRGEIDHSDHDHSLCAGLRQSSDLMADYRELLPLRCWEPSPRWGPDRLGSLLGVCHSLCGGCISSSWRGSDCFAW
jgi:hypothetical protein